MRRLQKHWIFWHKINLGIKSANVICHSQSTGVIWNVVAMGSVLLIDKLNCISVVSIIITIMWLSCATSRNTGALKLGQSLVQVSKLIEAWVCRELIGSGPISWFFWLTNQLCPILIKPASMSVLTYVKISKIVHTYVLPSVHKKFLRFKLNLVCR